MSRAHGVPGAFGPQAWTAARRTPPYYPDAVTLVPGADGAALTGRVDTSGPGATVKDSFADLDLTSDGFEVLFDAQWIHRPAGTPAGELGLAWRVAEDPAALRAWALAWDGGEGHADLFRPALLADPDTRLIAVLDQGGLVTGGAVITRAGGVTGVSNVFATGDAPAWPAVLDAAHRLFPGLPVVGYEHGGDLDVAVRHGFEPLGPLRVWLHTAS
ncbi:hypothetical protein [Actinacidiphila acidipaludis]|nr:hypothetical protein [Streptomyces acidipaludis]